MRNNKSSLSGLMQYGCKHMCSSVHSTPQPACSMVIVTALRLNVMHRDMHWYSHVHWTHMTLSHTVYITQWGTLISVHMESADLLACLCGGITWPGPDPVAAHTPTPPSPGPTWKGRGSPTMETLPGSNGATVGGGEVEHTSGSYFHYTHWYHVILDINNKHRVQM